MVQNCGLHRVWLERDSPITHITFNPKNPSHILLHDIYMFCVLDKSLVSPHAGSGGLGLCPGHLPCPAPQGAEGAVHGAEVVVVVPGSTDMCCVLSLQPLPDNSALLMNQSTLKQLPETARQRQLHAFKICKKFQVSDGVAGCVLCQGGGAGGAGGALCPWSLRPHWLLCPGVPGSIPAPGAQAAEQSLVSVPVTVQLLAAISWALVPQQLLQHTPPSNAPGYG